jgi:ABC-type Fe3+ transport system permease subunit
LNRADAGSKSCAATRLDICFSDGTAMIRFLLRSFGLWILAAGFVLFVYDGTKSIASSTLYFTALDDLLNLIYSRGSQDLLMPLVDRYFGHWLWETAMLPVLKAPGCIVFGVVGAFLILVGRKKKPLIGYAR